MSNVHPGYLPGPRSVMRTGSHLGRQVRAGMCSRLRDGPNFHVFSCVYRGEIPRVRAAGLRLCTRGVTQLRGVYKNLSPCTWEADLETLSRSFSSKLILTTLRGLGDKHKRRDLMFTSYNLKRNTYNFIRQKKTTLFLDLTANCVSKLTIFKMWSYCLKLINFN